MYRELYNFMESLTLLPMSGALLLVGCIMKNAVVLYSSIGCLVAIAIWMLFKVPLDEEEKVYKTLDQMIKELQ